MKKIIIITGGNRGLGKALIDVTLKDENTFIVSLSRSIHEEHKEICDSKMFFIKTDLADPFLDSIFEIVTEKLDAETSVYFFNNASVIFPIDKIGSFKEFDIETSIKVNVNYPVSFINSLLRLFPKNKKVLVNISSGAGNRPIPYWSLYGAAKAYLKLFFMVLEEENKVDPLLSLHSIDPGVLDTRMQEDIRESTFPNQDYFKSLKQDNKLIQPDDAALSILYKINYFE